MTAVCIILGSVMIILEIVVAVLVWRATHGKQKIEIEIKQEEARIVRAARGEFTPGKRLFN